MNLEKAFLVFLEKWIEIEQVCHKMIALQLQDLTV